MQILLRSPVRKTCWLAACLSVTVLYVGFATTEFLAAHFSDLPDLVSLKRAARLQPGNADLRYRLGQYLLLAEQSPEAAVESYRAAVALNPHQAHYWLDLASAYRLLNNSEGQRESLEHAIVADPKTPDVAWEAANFYLIQGDNDKALREFHVVLEGDLSLASLALQRCLRIDPSLNTILTQVLPPDTQVYFALLDLLMLKKDTPGAAKAWTQLAQLRQPLEARRIFDYIRYLIDQREIGQARVVWQQAATMTGLSAYQPSPENLVINGDFSLPVLNGGFDWLYHKSADVSLALDPTQPHFGSRSLSIVFDSPGIEDAGIQQLIPVQPSTSYQFLAYFKAEDMQGAGGPQFAVQDFYSGATYFASEDLKNAGFWKVASGSFITAPDAKLLLLRLRRSPAGSPIRGRLWIDGIRLGPAAQPQTGKQ
jgi:tetratricopeptide (TPR) repeat protein